jgi:hypothetical protein
LRLAGLRLRAVFVPVDDFGGVFVGMAPSIARIGADFAMGILRLHSKVQGGGQMPPGMFLHAQAVLSNGSCD